MPPEKENPVEGPAALVAVPAPRPGDGVVATDDVGQVALLVHVHPKARPQPLQAGLGDGLANEDAGAALHTETPWP